MSVIGVVMISSPGSGSIGGDGGVHGGGAGGAGVGVLGAERARRSRVSSVLTKLPLVLVSVPLRMASATGSDLLVAERAAVASWSEGSAHDFSRTDSGCLPFSFPSDLEIPSALRRTLCIGGGLGGERRGRCGPRAPRGREPAGADGRGSSAGLHLRVAEDPHLEGGRMLDDPAPLRSSLPSISATPRKPASSRRRSATTLRR